MVISLLYLLRGSIVRQSFNHSASKPPAHWLPNVKCLPSPNYNLRPAGACVNLLVIHNISLPCGHYGGGHIEQLFLNCLDCSVHQSFSDLQNVEVSSHLLIDRVGEVTQFVPLNYRAWHAGESSYQGCFGCNDFSIGIELEGSDNDPYTSMQYQALIELTHSIMKVYPDITANRIVGHCEIAPKRKTDPGPAFDWKVYLDQL